MSDLSLRDAPRRAARPNNRRPVRGRRRMTRFRSSINAAWLRAALATIARTGQVAVPLTPRTNLIVTNASALQHGYRSINDLKSAINSAMQGASAKAFGAAASAAAAAMTPSLGLGAAAFGCRANATAAAGTPVFGWKVKVGGSINNFAYRSFAVHIGSLTTDAAPALSLAANPTLSLLVETQLPVCEFIVLSPSNGAGQFTIVPGIQSQAVGASTTSSAQSIAIDAIDANTFVTFEGLNARDLLVRPMLQSSFRDADFADVYDEIGYDLGLDDGDDVDLDELTLRDD